jgi:hypothetical protein
MTNSVNEDSETILAAVEAYCVTHEAEIPYHVSRIREFAEDIWTTQEIASGWATEDDRMDASERLRQIQLYLENQGDKFHPQSDELHAIAGKSTPWES